MEIEYKAISLPWGDLPPNPPAKAAPKLGHGQRIRWYTSGFEYFWLGDKTNK